MSRVSSLARLALGKVPLQNFVFVTSYTLCSFCRHSSIPDQAYIVIE